MVEYAGRDFEIQERKQDRSEIFRKGHREGLDNGRTSNGLQESKGSGRKTEETLKS